MKEKQIDHWFLISNVGDYDINAESKFPKLRIP